MRVSAIVSMPPTLLATALVAGHAEHHGLADMAVQWALVLIGTALLINVVASAWAILRERETSATGDTGAISTSRRRRGVRPHRRSSTSRRLPQS